MATLIKTYYGETTGPSGSTSYRFRVVTQLQYTQTDATSGYYIQMRRYLEVTASPTSSVWAYATVNWQSARVGMAAAGTYADTGWVDVGWIAYGASYSWTCTGGYTGGSGSYYGSDASDSYTVPMPYYALDVNAKINGADAQPTNYCTFDMYLNDVLDSNDVGDFSRSVAHGTTFAVKDIKTKSGYVYNGVEPALSGTLTGAYTIWLKFLSLYAVTYNANGGSGAPSAQSKTYGVNLTLSSTKPEKTNTINVYTVTLNANGGTCESSSLTTKKTTLYSFSYWKGSDGKTYAPGATYSTNAALTLTAVWTSSVSKTAAVLPKPTRPGYKFLYWATSKTATSGYAAGEEFYNDGGITLYAIWEVDNAIYVKILEEWFFGNVYAKLDGRWSFAMNVYFKDDGRWHMSTK